jgi:ATP-dependent helicase/nuclease subunit B
MVTGQSTFPVRVVSSTSGSRRVEAAIEFLLAAAPSHSETFVVAPSRGAADDLVRAAAIRRAATIGWHRFSLTQCAARLALDALAAEGRLPSTPLGAEAVAARAIFAAIGEGALSYFGPVSRTPGFPRALAKTVSEVRLSGVDPHLLSGHPHGGPDLAALLSKIEEEFDRAGAVDRARLLATARVAVESRRGDLAERLRHARLVVVDPPCATASESAWVASLVQAAATALVLVPADAAESVSKLGALATAGIESLPEDGPSSLAQLRERLFKPFDAPAEPGLTGVTVLSAPGEARESVEVVRRILDEARRGVRFDEMAVLLRAPHQYLGLLEHALARAGIPAWFDRGTKRPDPAGRALLSLLHCAEEGLSARRFAEYLSLAQVPDAGADVDVPAGVAPDDEILTASLPEDADGADPIDVLRVAASIELPVVDGTLRTPRRWEALLVESAVIGGLDRWRSRLDGLAHEYRRRLTELEADEPESARAAGLARDLEHLGHLRTFAIPIIETLDLWRETSGRWGEWLERLEELSPRVLRQPTRVVRVLAELRPMADVGPVGIGEVRKVLSERLRLLSVEPPSRRYGSVLVGSTEQARGRRFKVVFVPGLAERIFPQKLREDPLLLDDVRRALDGALPDRRRRAVEERLHLQLAVGAATERLYLSYPRLDVNESRPRVPSFYALDVKRALTGRIPSHDELQQDAFDSGAATLAWPAPVDPMRAIDPLEHDLAILRPLFDERDRDKVAGRARYLLELNPALGRSVRSRWARYHRQWSESDGFIKPSDSTRDALAASRLDARPYSLSALQLYASCPYRFLLSAIYRLAPREEATPIQRLDPLTKGSLFHRVQAEFLRSLRDAGGLPIGPADVGAAEERLGETLTRIAEEERARLAPAITRVWDDEVAAMRRDLTRWVRLLATDADGWVPTWFEYAFGLPGDEGRDAASRSEPVTIDGRFVLRGSMDMVERHPAGALRVTDHKTGRARWPDTMVVAGGEALQPVLYGLVLEAATGEHVHSGRLWFCTAAGGFKEIPVPITETTRRSGLEVLEVIDRGIELGTLAAIPKSGACAWCDFRAVCGPHEEWRTGRKAAGQFPDLDALRGRP